MLSVRYIERDGYAIVPDVLAAPQVDRLLDHLSRINEGEMSQRRAGIAFGVRNLLNVVPAARELANSSDLQSLVEAVLGCTARVVRGVYFDKHKDANWKVAWHQDLTISVRERAEVEGYGPWTLKAGIHHVQPPLSILQNMLGVRVHLDQTDEANGALRVFPGSHGQGRMSAEDIARWKERHTNTVCSVNRGGVMLMRPLLLHASSVATHAEHRRVLHFEYSSVDLEGGLEWYEA